MSTTQKREFLEALGSEIVRTIPNAWLFPHRGPVFGFLGTAPVMLVAERPSTGRFESSADKLLYSLLNKLGVPDAHLTDVIKSRGKVGDPYPSDISEHRRIFDRELDIIQPRLIVAFGQKVYDLLQFTLAGGSATIRTVWHYSYTRRGADKPGAFEEQLRKALDGAP